MTEPMKSDVARKGYAFVQDYGAEAETIAVADMIGTPLTPWDGRLVQDLIPRAKQVCTAWPTDRGCDSVFVLIRGGGTWLGNLRWRRLMSRKRR